MSAAHARTHDTTSTPGNVVPLKRAEDTWNLDEVHPETAAQRFDPEAPAEARSIGGYGVFFIMKIMDGVKYDRIDDNNILTMIKFPSAE